MMKDYANDATRYCERVASGDIVASKWIKLAAQRHLDDLKRTGSRWHYDYVQVNRACSFIESLTLESGQRFTLSDWQIWLTASLMGWVDADGLRKHIEAYVVVAKGNGKSPWAAAMSLLFAFGLDVPKAEVYCGAMSLLQADEVHRVARHFVESNPAFAAINVLAQKKSIFSLAGSRFQPVISRGRHGARPLLAVQDEYHQAISDDLYGTFKTGCNKTVNSLLLTITTAGVASTASPCYQLQERAIKAIDGSMTDERFFTAIYAADDTVEWTSEEALLMANPNLGISNDAEKIRLAIVDATRNPAHANNVKAMHLNVWSTASASWMNMTAWSKCYDPHLTQDTVKHLPCWIGSDLASKIDLSACVRLYRDDSQGDRPHYYALCRAYLPEERVNLPENTHYQKWVAEGHLNATPGSSIDYAMLEADALADIAENQVREFPYDQRYADQWSQRVSDLSGIERIETPPSPAVLSPAMKELEAAVADGRFHHDGDPVLTWCMSNVLTRETATGNYTMPDKSRPENKIDCAVALFIAMSRARLAEPEPQATYGFLFA
ncbi:terminase large subunit [Granulicella cerasi]|uniref:Terminase large subunit n=1 Tax=Granulicella cerasi TaxID=741063 RepID=A0ABW1Z628_9BACT|nr:terminase TerL endonuclease subunit [Granulicella cerasi]